MELIKILFFALGTFFGIEDNRIIAENTHVKIDTKNRIITIQQTNLFTMTKSESDSIKVSEQLYQISNTDTKEKEDYWLEDFKDYKSKTIEFLSNKNIKQLDAILKLKYNTPRDLKDFSIDYNDKESSYAIINIPSWNIETDKGELRDNYWYFTGEVEFDMSPVKNMPKEYKSLKKGLLSIWVKLKP